MKITVTVEADIEVEFDENSAAFKEMFEGYKELIDPNADYETLTENIISLVARYGLDEFIEGVGYPKSNGEKHRTYIGGVVEHDCPINIICDTDINNRIDFCVHAEINE